MIRAATPSDADAIAPVHARGWTVGYERFLPAGFVVEGAGAQEWAARLEPGPYRTLVWEDDGRITAFVSFGPCERVDNEPRGTGIVMALYVDAPAQRAGVGRALLTAALDALRADGMHQAILWVFRDNDRARRYYEKLGWRWDGGEVAHERVGIPELRYRIVL